MQTWAQTTSYTEFLVFPLYIKKQHQLTRLQGRVEEGWEESAEWVSPQHIVQLKAMLYPGWCQVSEGPGGIGAPKLAGGRGSSHSTHSDATPLRPL